MTKSEFLRLNTKRAIEKGGTFNALLDTAITKKAPGGGSNSDNSDAFVIKTVDKGIAVLGRVPPLVRGNRIGERQGGYRQALQADEYQRQR